MRKASRDFLGKLLSAPGPSGYEGPVRKVWKAEVETHADHVSVDVHGSAIAVTNAGGEPRVMLAGHMDELGFQVVHVDDEGFISFDTVGGFDIRIVPGRKVRVHTEAGEVLGVIGKKPVHLLTGAERDKAPAKHELWIDVGAKNGKEARQLVAIGDPVNGGMHGEYPSLKEKDLLEGDLHFNIDFRGVYGTMVERWLGLDPMPLVGGNFEQLGFL